MNFKIKKFVSQNLIFLLILLISGYIKRSSFPLVDSVFFVGILNIITYLWQVVKKLGFFDFTMLTFTNFANLLKSAIERKEFKVKSYKDSNIKKSDPNFLFLVFGIILLFISTILY